MSDSEVEKWETKIKDSLLRRDSNLSTIMNAMTTSMTKGISINGNNFSAFQFWNQYTWLYEWQRMSIMLIILTVMRMMKIHQEIKISSWLH